MGKYINYFHTLVSTKYLFDIKSVKKLNFCSEGLLRIVNLHTSCSGSPLIRVLDVYSVKTIFNRQIAKFEKYITIHIRSQ